MIIDIIDVISFRGERLEIAWRGEEPYVALRPICERLGLDWKSQHRKISAPENGWCVVMMTTHDASGRQQEMLCLHVVDVPLWLANIKPAKVRPELAEAVRAYREECKLVLFHYVKSRLLGERDAATATLARLQADLIARKPLWVKVERLVAAGQPFEAIWRAAKRPRHVVVEALGDLLRLGFIDALPEGTPYPQPVRPIEMDQLALFPEG